MGFDAGRSRQPGITAECEIDTRRLMCHALPDQSVKKYMFLLVCY